jgi:hypothetical protein
MAGELSHIAERTARLNDLLAQGVTNVRRPL